jgi:hypothetical protein
LLKPKIEDYPGKLFKLKIDNPDPDFAEAKDLAKQKEEETGADPMLLSWREGDRYFMLDTNQFLCNVGQKFMHKGASHAKNPAIDNK